MPIKDFEKFSVWKPVFNLNIVFPKHNWPQKFSSPLAIITISWDSLENASLKKIGLTYILHLSSFFLWFKISSSEALWHTFHWSSNPLWTVYTRHKLMIWKSWKFAVYEIDIVIESRHIKTAELSYIYRDNLHNCSL